MLSRKGAYGISSSESQAFWRGKRNYGTNFANTGSLQEDVDGHERSGQWEGEALHLIGKGSMRGDCVSAGSGVPGIGGVNGRSLRT